MYRPQTDNMRNVWLLGPNPSPTHTSPFSPPRSRDRAILAGTSERGVCPKCGAPWARMVEKKCNPNRPGGYNVKHYAGRGDASDLANRGRVGDPISETLGWRATCGCDASEPIPPTVLDPFLGSGTTALVADRLGRNCIGIELSEAYAAMARRRCEDDAGLFAEVAAE